MRRPNRIMMIACIAVSAIGSALARPANAAIADGSLVQAEGTTGVFLIESGLRRWIDSPRAFQVHGFDWSAIRNVAPDALAAHPEGERITPLSRLALPWEHEVLPDLAPFPFSDIRLLQRDGRVHMVFTSAFWNRGKGTFVIVATDAAGGDEHLTRVAQRISSAGGSRSKELGSIEWHDLHAHYHYGDFASYHFEPADGTAVNVPSVRYKTTFCMFDTKEVVGIAGESPKGSQTYSGCGRTQQGVSVGWADVYPWDLPDQYIDVTDMPAGRYRFSFVVDPNELFVERSYGNNTSIVIIDIDPAALTHTIRFAGAPFATPENRYAEGFAFRIEGTPDTFVIAGGKKRRQEVPLGSAYELPRGVVEAIPDAADLVKVSGAPEVYLVNDFGHRRHIPNYEVFRSYGWTDADISIISAEAMSAYPVTRLIRRIGSDAVYFSNDGRFAGRLGDLPGLGLEPFAVHAVNDREFDGYAVSTVAEGLDIPWGVAFLPDGDLLVTERTGTVRRIGQRPSVMHVPAAKGGGEGGLMGIALHPSFDQNGYVYLYFTDTSGTNRIQRFRYDGNALSEDAVIISGIPGAIYHDGGQIAFGPDGMLYATTGDATRPELAQDLSSLAGKTLRLTPDGAVPADNPFGTAVWSYGHRNAQGIAWDAQGRMWQTEHGRSGVLSGFDELNLVERGGNYGWPVIQGDAQQAGMRGPAAHSGSTSTWAPAGIAHVNGTFYFAGLRGASLYRAVPAADGGSAIVTPFLSGMYGRLRAVVLGPDGALYVSTSNRDGRGTVRTGDDRLLKIFPAMLR